MTRRTRDFQDRVFVLVSVAAFVMAEYRQLDILAYLAIFCAGCFTGFLVERREAAGRK